MKKRLLLTLLAGWVLSLGAFAQAEVKILSDVTSKIVNADFSADEPVAVTIVTYDYNMADAGAGAGGTSLFGQQPVTGWTASHLSDNIKVMENSGSPDRGDGTNAKAAGVFALSDPELEVLPGLGGDYIAPFSGEDADAAGVAGPVLGMCAVWGSDYKYTQEVTLSAGDYMMLVTYRNVGSGSDIAKNNTGFTAASGTAYLSARTNFPIDVWAQDTIAFRLTEETTGEISIGLKGDGGSGGAAHLFFDSVKLYQIDTNYLDQAEIDAAKERLLALIEKGNEYGVDTEATQAVYDDPAATLAQVLAAIEAQQEANDAAITDLSDFFIRNPKFSEGDAVVGGICTYDYDCEKNGIALTNYSMLDVPGWTQNKTDNGAAAGLYAVGSDAFLGGKGFNPPATLSDGVTTEANLLGIVTCWGFPAQYKQNVTLPAGKYTIVMSYYNSGGANAAAQNLIGFVANNGTEYLGETLTFPVGKWLTESVKFELDDETDGYFTLGYKGEGGSGNLPHLFVDGFKLYYVGTGLNASLFALQAAVSSASRLLDGAVFNVDLREQLESAVEKGRELVSATSNDDEANMEATSAITELIDQVNASITAYADLQKFYDGDLAEAYERYDEATYPELSEQLSDMVDKADQALLDCDWTNEQIEEFLASFATVVKEGVKKVWDEAIASGEALEKDLDITVLFDQMSYTYSTSAVSGSSVPDKEWKYGSASNFKTQYGTAEVWNQSPFEVSRTLSELPAGKYTITTKAFFRNADNATNYSDYDEAKTPEASLFAGSQTTGLTNVAALANDEQLEDWAAAGAQFVPNSQRAAYNVFNDDAYTGLLQKSVSTVLTAEGDLTFGIKADQMSENCWVIWYGFSLTYNALDDDALNDEIDALIARVTELEEVLSVNKALDGLDEAKGAGEEAIDSDSKDDKVAAIQTLKDAIAYAEKGLELQEELSKQETVYSDLRSKYDYSSDDTTLDDLLGLLEGEKDSNEQIEGWIDELPKAWAAYVLGQDLTEATAENAVDLTGILINADFEGGNANYWTIDEEIGQNLGYQNNNVYTNDETGEEMNQFIEAWRPAGVGVTLSNGDISQTLSAILPEGYYMLSCLGFAKHENSRPEEGFHGAYLFAEVGETTYLTEMGLEILADEETGALSLENHPKLYERAFYSDGVSPVTVGLRIKDTNVNWVAADNFTLLYTGAENPDPTAVEGVEADTTPKSVAIYNLAGQRVQKAVKGLYIINGKKYLVK